MATCIASDKGVEIDAQGRPCVTYGVLYLDSTIPNGADLCDVAVPILEGDSVNVQRAKIAAELARVGKERWPALTFNAQSITYTARDRG